MKHRLILSITALFCFYLTSSAQEVEAEISPEEFSGLIGEWKGTLTYLNYSDNRRVTMPSNLVISEGNNEYVLNAENIYPNEPQANNKGKWKISKDGKQINGQPIVKKEKNENAVVYVVQYEGKDDNKKAEIKLTYKLTSNSFLNRKEVRFSDKEEWILRNEFSYTK